MLTLLLQFYCDLALQSPPKTLLMNNLVMTLYELTQQFPQKSAETLKSFLASREEEIAEEVKRRNGKASMPSLDTVRFYRALLL
jgi:hypothetical protein